MSDSSIYLEKLNPIYNRLKEVLEKSGGDFEKLQLDLEKLEPEFNFVENPPEHLREFISLGVDLENEEEVIKALKSLEKTDKEILVKIFELRNLAPGNEDLKEITKQRMVKMQCE